MAKLSGSVPAIIQLSTGGRSGSGRERGGMINRTSNSDVIKE
jgi:hypothetical protein